MILNGPRTEHLHATDVRFTPASADLRATGLLGFVSCSVAGMLHLDGLTLRRTRRGELRLSFPSRPRRDGGRRYIVRPLDDESRVEVERQVFQALHDAGVEL